MVKIHIKELEGDKTIPLPYFAIKKFLIKANESSQNNEENIQKINDIIKAIKAFAKKHPGFVLAEIQDKQGTGITISL